MPRRLLNSICVATTASPLQRRFGVPTFGKSRLKCSFITHTKSRHHEANSAFFTCFCLVLAASKTNFNSLLTLSITLSIELQAVCSH